MPGDLRRCSAVAGPVELRAQAARLNVVIVSYQCRELLRSCLDSLASQTIWPELSVVVVDNASTDGTPAMVREDYPSVTLVANGRNDGFGRAANVGLRAVASGHALVLNPDTVLPPDALERALDALDARPEVGLLGCKLVKPDGTVDHASRRQIPTPASSLAYMLRLDRWGLGDRERAYTDPDSYDKEGPVGAVNGAFLLLRDEVLREVGGFDEAFWMYGEDLDLCLRVTQAGWTVYYWPALEVLHEKGGSSGQARALRVNWAFHRAMWIFFAKHQASGYGTAASVAVGLAISARFLISVLRSGAVRSFAKISERPGRVLPIERKLAVVAVSPDDAEVAEEAVLQRLLAHPRVAGTLVATPGARRWAPLLALSREADITVVAGGGRRPWLVALLLRLLGRRSVQLGELLDGARTVDLEDSQDPVDLAVAELAALAHRPGAGLRAAAAMSVVVTVLNEERAVDALLDVLEPQLEAGDELIVVDGGSTDGTTKRLEARARTNPRLRVLVRPGTNISAGRNVGIAAANNDLIACTDAGCSPAPDWLAALRRAFAEKRTPGLVASIPLVLGNGALERAQALACYPHPDDDDRPNLLIEGYGRVFGQVFRPSLPFARSMAFTKDAWREVGGFPEALGWVEDGVFGLEIAKSRPALATRDARLSWTQRGSLRATARMYYRYGIGAAQSQNRSLVFRDALRLLAYPAMGVLAARGRRRAVPILGSAALAYYSLPMLRALRTRAPLRVWLLIPAVMAIKDASKVAGEVGARLPSRDKRG